jgi:dihydroorotate dehydrogenase
MKIRLEYDLSLYHHQNLRSMTKLEGLLGINLGKNKEGVRVPCSTKTKTKLFIPHTHINNACDQDFRADLMQGTQQLGPLADYLTLNLSQLNTTPELRGILSKCL